VHGYFAIEAIAQSPSVSVDFAGNAAVLAGIHTHLGDALKHSCLVGATHVGARGEGGTAALPGPAPILFFAPDHATSTLQEMGAQGFAKSVAARWHAFVDETQGFMAIDHRDGLKAASDAFGATLAGKADPAVGIIVRP
jgi:hypothetical protein